MTTHDDDISVPQATFPEACPWTLGPELDADFWPEARPLS
jgi:hypothetical protein